MTVNVIGECKNDGILRYYAYGDEYYVGDNTTNYANAPLLGFSFSGTLNVPDYFESKPIVALGQYSFTQCINLTKAIIGKNVREIHYYALGDLPNLAMIFIPSSVEYIGAVGIAFWGANPKEIKQILFEPGSKLKYIGHVFHRANHVQLYIPNITIPKCGMVFDQKKVILISKYSFTFCGIKSKKLCTKKPHKNNKTPTLLLIVLVELS